MKRIKLIALDMDGTLLANDHQTIPPENIRAIRAAQAAGICVCICTGRMLEDASDFAARYGLKCMIISGNGTRAADAPLPEGTVFLRRNLKPEDAHAAIDIAAASGLAIHAFEDGAVNSLLGASGQKYHLLERGLIDANYGLAALHEAADRGLMKIFIVGDGFAGDMYSDQVGPLKERMIAALGHLDITSSGAGNVEVVSGEAGKGSALKAAAEHLGFMREEVMAMGDAGNDLSMLEYAYHSVAMANATPDVLQACRYTTGSNDECGVAQMIWRVLEEQKG